MVNINTGSIKSLSLLNLSNIVDCVGAFFHSLFLDKDNNLYFAGAVRKYINITNKNHEEIRKDLVLIDKNVDVFTCSSFFGLLAKKMKYIRGAIMNMVEFSFRKRNLWAKTS
ncbi:hypothetical protein COBT_003067 [Conglomerata obtusa]